MKKLFAACAVPMSLLTACAGNQTMPSLSMPSFDNKKPLETVDLDQPNVTFTFRSTRERHRSGDAFAPPKTIDCSKLSLTTDAFKDAIKAGALIVRIDTPRQVMQKIPTKNGRETTKVVPIKPVYGGVLALCTVSDKATGPDARSYHIRGLDDYLVKGKDGNISAVGAVLDHKKSEHNWGNDLLKSQLSGELGLLAHAAGMLASDNNDSSAEYSWMLWLTDRKTTFTNYEAELAKGKVTSASR